jgi:hypothetical protein
MVASQSSSAYVKPLSPQPLQRGPDYESAATRPSMVASQSSSAMAQVDYYLANRFSIKTKPEDVIKATDSREIIYSKLNRIQEYRPILTYEINLLDPPSYSEMRSLIG